VAFSIHQVVAPTFLADIPKGKSVGWAIYSKNARLEDFIIDYDVKKTLTAPGLHQYLPVPMKGKFGYCTVA
jgi:hypothetical protein